jgi:hypothetical protein
MQRAPSWVKAASTRRSTSWSAGPWASGPNIYGPPGSGSEELQLSVNFSFSPEDQSETVVLVRGSTHRNGRIAPSAQRQK